MYVLLPPVYVLLFHMYVLLPPVYVLLFHLYALLPPTDMSFIVALQSGVAVELPDGRHRPDRNADLQRLVA
jgi:hypothetical protein